MQKGMQNLGLLVSYGVGLKRDRRFHRGQGKQLHDMIGNHVAQGSGSVEVAATPLHAYGFGVSDLHVVNVTSVPDRLKDGIVETEDHDVLYGFLAQIVIVAIDLVFLQPTLDLAVLALRRFQVVSKWLFNHHPAPAALVLDRQTSLPQLLDNLAKEPGSGRHVKEIVAFAVVLEIQLAEALLEL